MNDERSPGARGRLLAMAAMRPDLVRVRRVSPVVVPAGEPARPVKSDQPRWGEAETFTDERHRDRCGSCRRTIRHRSQVRCPWLGCRAWFKGFGDVT